jgi:hypothetical protein
MAVAKKLKCDQTDPKDLLACMRKVNFRDIAMTPRDWNASVDVPPLEPSCRGAID